MLNTMGWRVLGGENGDNKPSEWEVCYNLQRALQVSNLSPQYITIKQSDVLQFPRSSGQKSMYNNIQFSIVTAN